MANQQAGWYPDPSGDTSKLRYWDGSQWTNDFSDVPQNAVPSADSAAPQPAVEPPVQQAQPVVEPVQQAQPVPVQPAQSQVFSQETTYTNPNANQQPYIGQTYGQVPAQQQTNGLAIASLICGIVGLCPYAFTIPSIVAIILGIFGRKNSANKGMALAGLILGIIGVVLFIIVLIVGFLALDSGYYY